jgi:WD40 repeat protein
MCIEFYSIRFLTGSSFEDAVGVSTWDYSTGKKLHTLPLPPGSPSGIALYPHGSGWLTVASGGSAWRFVRDGDEWRTFGSVSPDAARQVGISAVADRGDILALGGGHSLVLADREGAAVVLADGEKPNVQRLAFDPRGRFVATSASDGKISLWKFGNWHHIRTWSAESQPLWDFAFTPDGASLVSMGPRGLVIWDPMTGTQQRIIETGIIRRTFAISPDSRLVASSQMLRGAPYSIRLWSLADGSVHQTISHPSAKIRGQLAFAESGNTLVMGGGKGVTVWNLAKSTLTADLGSKTVHDVPIAVHADGKRVAMAPWYGPIEIWDITTQRNVLSVRVHGAKALVNSIAIHPSGKYAASAAKDGTACLWEFDTGAAIKLWQLGPPKGIVFQVAFSPDGRYLATVNGNGTAYILRLDRIVGANK